MSHLDGIKPGDVILLNERAKDWTSGERFTVEELKSWGVVCYAVSEGGQVAYYRALWREIDEIVLRAAPSAP